MNTFIKTSLISYLAVVGVISSAVVTASESPAPKEQAAVGVGESTKPNPIIPETYVLYSIALRDGKAAKSSDATMSMTKNSGKTVYTFKEHILKECGSHLNGTIEVIDSGSNNIITADFPTVVNSMGITHFSLKMTEDKINKIKSTGTGSANDEQFSVADLVALPGFVDAVTKM
jgi:hypothetical protein